MESTPSVRSGDRQLGTKLHPSTSSHLAIEITVLRGLIDRSKFQHRSQPFLQRMREVYRLAGRIQSLDSAAEGPDREMMKRLLPKFVQAIIKAAISTQQIIELEHFLPTHISVLAVYGRLFALASHLGQHHSLELEELLGGQAKKEDIKIIEAMAVSDSPVNDSTLSASTLDLGQKIERKTASAPSPSVPAAPVIATPPVHELDLGTPARSPSPVPSQDSPDPDFPVVPTTSSEVPEPTAALVPLEKPKKKRVKAVSDELERVPVKKAKKKKRDDIDDIFGL